MRNNWPLDTWLSRHPLVAGALLVAILILQMAADGLLEQMQ